MNTTPPASLPVTRNLLQSYTLSFIVALLMTIVLLAGIFSQSVIYPTQERRQSFVPNDVVNLLIGLPILLGSIWSAWHGKLTGILFLSGALFYVLYNHTCAHQKLRPRLFRRLGILYAARR